MKSTTSLTALVAGGCTLAFAASMVQYVLGDLKVDDTPVPLTK